MRRQALGTASSSSPKLRRVGIQVGSTGFVSAASLTASARTNSTGSSGPRVRLWLRILGEVSPIQAAAVDRNLDLLYRRIWREPSLTYHLEHLQDYDRVLEIFARANAGGTKLDKSDLLLSMVTAKWEHMNARDEIYRVVDRINKELPHRNDINKDFVLKCALVLSDLPVAYIVDNFTVANMQLIAAKWPQIKQALEAGFNLVNSFGVDRTNLTSLNAVIPIIYYLMRHRDLKIGGSTPFDIKNAQAIRKWLALALLAQLFGGHSDSMLQKTRNVLKAESDPLT